MRKLIMFSAHNSVCVCPMDLFRVYNTLRRFYYCPNVTSEIQDYAKILSVVQTHERDIVQIKGELHSFLDTVRLCFVALDCQFPYISS